MTEAATRPPAAQKRLDPGALLLTALTIIAAVMWFFPVYWALVTSLRSDEDTVKNSA
jgi:multiple sugar transport system permease protein